MVLIILRPKNKLKISSFLFCIYFVVLLPLCSFPSFFISTLKATNILPRGTFDNYVQLQIPFAFLHFFPRDDKKTQSIRNLWAPSQMGMNSMPCWVGRWVQGKSFLDLILEWGRFSPPPSCLVLFIKLNFKYIYLYIKLLNGAINWTNDCPTRLKWSKGWNPQQG